MLILLRNREDELIERKVEVGSKLVGLRLLEVTFESREELRKLLSEEGKGWAQRNLLPAMKY